MDPFSADLYEGLRPAIKGTILDIVRTLRERYIQLRRGLLATSGCTAAASKKDADGTGDPL